MSRNERIDNLLHAWAAGRQARTGFLAHSPVSSRSARRSGLTRPEAAADRAAEMDTVDWIIRSVLSRRKKRLVVARYVRQIDSDRQIARRLRMDRKYIGLAYDDLREEIHNILRARRPQARAKHNMLTVAPQADTLPATLNNSL